MSVQELESAVAKLSRDELAKFNDWYADFLAERWDRQFEQDAASGKLDKLSRKADEDFEAGRCTPL